MSDTAHRVTFRIEVDDCLLNTGFSANEWSKLTDFLHYCREIEKTQLVQAGLPLSMEMQGNSTGQLSFRVTLPHDDLVAAFLHRMRPIVLQNEQTNFYRVVSVLERNIQNTVLRNAFREERQIFQGIRSQHTFKLSVNDQLINSDQILNAYLNAYEYHTDHEKQRKLTDLHRVVPHRYNWGICLLLLGEKAGSAFRIANFIRELDDQHRGQKSRPLRDELVSFINHES